MCETNSQHVQDVGVIVKDEDACFLSFFSLHSPVSAPNRCNPPHKVGTTASQTNTLMALDTDMKTRTYPHIHSWPYQCFLLGCFPISDFVSIETTDGALCLEDNPTNLGISPHTHNLPFGLHFLLSISLSASSLCFFSAPHDHTRFMNRCRQLYSALVLDTLLHLCRTD